MRAVSHRECTVFKYLTMGGSKAPGPGSRACAISKTARVSWGLLLPSERHAHNWSFICHTWECVSQAIRTLMSFQHATDELVSEKLDRR